MSSPEEQLNKTVSDILVEIKQEALVTPDDEYILISTHTDERWRAIRYLVKLGAIKATEYSPVGAVSTIKVIQQINGRVYKPNAYTVEIIQPKFNKIYKKYQNPQREPKKKNSLPSKKVGSLDYQQSLFLLKIMYSKLLEILDVFAGGYIAVRSPALNHHYTILTSLTDDFLNKQGFEELKKDKPELFESLVGNIEDYDIEWEFGSKAAYSFLGKIEKQYILSGSPVFVLQDEVKTFLQKTDEVMSEFNKQRNELWKGMMSRVDKQTELLKKQWEDVNNTPKQEVNVQELVHKIAITEMPPLVIKKDRRPETQRTSKILPAKDLQAEVTIGNLAAYNDGSIKFNNESLQMRNQLKDLCRLFMSRPDTLTTIDQIRDEVIAAQKRKSTPFSTIAKYVSELHTILQIHFQQPVIFNQKEEGWYFRPPK